MTYNQSYAKTVTPRYKQDYNKEEIAIITQDKCQVDLLKKRNRNFKIYQRDKIYKFVIIEI